MLEQAQVNFYKWMFKMCRNKFKKHLNFYYKVSYQKYNTNSNNGTLGIPISVAIGYLSSLYPAPTYKKII